MRRAGVAYRAKLRSRRLQAARQARYRDRIANFSDRKVTHQAVTQAAVTATSLVALEIVSGGKDQDEKPESDLKRCSLCDAVLPVWALREPRHSRTGRRRSPRLPRAPSRRS
jgi:hypothetical protein